MALTGCRWNGSCRNYGSLYWVADGGYIVANGPSSGAGGVFAHRPTCLFIQIDGVGFNILLHCIPILDTFYLVVLVRKHHVCFA